ncbi:MAG: SDR family oxidoreductase [Alphaproteobacteria bacterium]|jgi:NAD(P)-dependent dehydrogenase (short-subunit alcohol dehydrogenase family)|nr:short-chain dehydrogenase [Magnetovibrio sp.]HBT41669.1 short-chain dehydrogenase [Rhodospirillaceae bacterium]HCS68799.1 short-chain dehydrogenase [Rhodospirillaceae bacterium]|tara:strand:+ start:5823 stop:6509 length:687 start_codon:yes stop_codon:yes gene_type:complete
MPTVFITGANRGIGLEMARQYGADGWSVIATCRNPIAPGELATIQGDIRVHGLDVADHRQVDRLAGEMAGTKIDLLINNAGVYGDRNYGYQDIDYMDWEQSFRINTMAPLKVAGAFLPLVAANGGGMIATVSSVLSSIAESSPNSASYAYRTSKAAVNMAMHVFAEEVRAQNVAVVLLHPGWVQTDMGGAAAAIDARTSVTGIRKVLADAGMAESGRLFAYDGREIPW